MMLGLLFFGAFVLCGAALAAPIVAASRVKVMLLVFIMLICFVTSLLVGGGMR